MLRPFALYTFVLVMLLIPRTGSTQSSAQWTQCKVKSIAAAQREVLVDLSRCQIPARGEKARAAAQKDIRAKIVISRSYGRGKFDSHSQNMKERLERAMFDRKPVGVMIQGNRADGNIIQSVVELLSP